MNGLDLIGAEQLEGCIGIYDVAPRQLKNSLAAAAPRAAAGTPSGQCSFSLMREAYACGIIGAMQKSNARRDMVAVIVVSLAAAVTCVRLNLSEAMVGWMRRHENLQVDELPGILLVVAACLIWFSTRRYLEASRELELRRATEAKLAEALAENQRLAQQYLDKQEHERKALARDLHDELGQTINAIKLDAVAVREVIPPAEDAARMAAGEMIANIDRVYAVVAGLIRQLRPVALDELGVAAALEHCVGDWRQRLPSTRIHLSIECELSGLDGDRALALFRLVQESLTNVARHAQARRVDIRVAARGAGGTPECIEATIADDGRGADLDAPGRGLGLIGMRERTAAFGGSLALSSSPGAGFKVCATLPITASQLDGLRV
jgi:two-component system sensor histidine kinase UhpB